MELQPGVRLGPYEIVAPLGAGGMGEVYRARDTRLNRSVAIKILPADFASDARLRIRFEREAKAISSLNHPHICALHDIGRENGIDFLVMEHCEGKTLAKRIADGALPFEQVLQYGMEMADALEKAHKQGIIHRDLKPANVMITKSGVKLLDFGLAKEHVESSADASTMEQVSEEGKIVGTIQYMAPELLQGKAADARSDIFALGLVLYEMVTGKPAFSGTSKASLIAAILEHEPQPIADLKPASPPALDRLIRACLAKDPDERIQTAHDLKLQLRWIGEGTAQTPRSSSKRMPWTIVTIALLVAAIVSAGFILLRRTTIRPSPQPLRRYAINLPPNLPILGMPAISSDGRYVAYRSGRRLYLRRMDSGETSPLAGTEDSRFPFFSPDGAWIGFYSETGQSLMKIAISGGAPVTICKVTQPGRPTALRGATWLKDDTIIFGGPSAALRRVPASGGVPEAVAPLPKGQLVRWPFILPDQRHILYTIHDDSGNYDRARIAVLSLDDGHSDVIFEGGTFPRYASGHLLFFHAGSLFAMPFDLRKLKPTGSPVQVADDVADIGLFGVAFYDVAADGTVVYTPRSPLDDQRELVWIDRKGKATPLSSVRRGYEFVALSPDGTKLATNFGRRGKEDLWLYDLRRDAWNRLTTDEGAVAFVWSADGRQIYYSSSRSGAFNIYAMPIDGSGAARAITRDKNGWLFPESVSHDGRFMLVGQGARSGINLLVLDLKSEDRVQPLLTAHATNDAERFSPDGRWFIFVSNETGDDEVYLTTFPDAGRKWLISSGGGEWPLWRGDGRQVVYTSGKKLMVVDVDLRPDPIIGKPVALFESDINIVDMTADGQRFIGLRTESNPAKTALNVITGLFDHLSAPRRN